MEPQSSRWVAVAAVLFVFLGGGCCLGGVVAFGAFGAAQAGQQQQASNDLSPDAPVPAQFLAYVMAAGSLCAEVGPAEIAAQLDLESSWNPDAYTDSGAAPAMGIAQFTAATWQTWGHDYDTNGTSSPYDAGDAIIAQGHLMCSLVAWAETNLSNGALHGDVLDLAWAAYFAGRDAILRAGGVPSSGLTHDYPEQVRARLATYARDTGGDGLPGGGGGIPAGFTLPTNAQQATAVRYALDQLGKPYQYGAEGPNAFDCSGLVMQAWLHAGISIPRVTGDQVHTGVAVTSLAAMQPGDLIFIPGADGTLSHPGHVGMYIGRGGDGRQYLVQAPHTGDHVKVTLVADFTPLAAIRRPLAH